MEEKTVLIADDNESVRTLLADVIAETCHVAVAEAKDGAHAVQLGLQRRPHVALLDLHMPRLDGIRAAETLHGLLPAMAIALHSSDPVTLRQRGRRLGLPLFDKMDIESMVAWVDGHGRSRPRRETKRELVCKACGYGIVVETPPESCPLCRSDRPWVAALERPRASGAHGG